MKTTHSIPTTLEECFRELDNTLPEEIKAEIKNLNSAREMIRYHHGIGAGLRNSWGLWTGSPLKDYFLERGISFGDDLSWAILYNYYRWLKGEQADWDDEFYSQYPQLDL